MPPIQKTLKDLNRRPPGDQDPKTGPSRDASTPCAVCGGFGWRLLRPDEPEYRPGQLTNVLCEACLPRQIARNREEMQTASMLTESEKALRLDGILARPGSGTEKMIQACREMLAGRANFLTFWGSHGNAKSAALIATVNEFLDHGTPALYIPAWELLNHVQQAFSSGAEIKDDSAFERLDHYRRVWVLAIDELQAIRVTDWRLEQIRNLIDWRWRRGIDGAAYTLLAMNEDPRLLEPRLISRLNDGRNRLDGDPILHNTDPDMRPLMKG